MHGIERSTINWTTYVALVIVAAVSLGGQVGCLTAGGAGERETRYESCVHHAFELVSDGWVCSADGQIVGTSFSGHVVAEDRTGRLVPLKEVQFWRAYVAQSGVVGQAEPLDVSVSSDGWFSIPQPVGYTEALQKKNGHFVATEDLDDYVFTVRAEGCDDYAVHFRPYDPERIIIMKCEDRESAPRGNAQ